MQKQSWCKMARTVFGKKATLNIGDGNGGQFAVVTPCRNQVHFSLSATREVAEKCKRRLDRGGCCGGCQPWRHYIGDLGEVK